MRNRISSPRSLPDQSPRITVSEKLAAKALGLALLMAVAFGLVGSRPAQAQEGVSLDGQRYTIPAWAWKIITNTCGEPPEGDARQDPFWSGCYDEELRMLGLSNKGAPPSGQGQFVNPSARIAAQASGSGSSGLTLSSGTPYLPFLGNQLVELGWIPNSTSISDVTAVYTTDLLRQSDCSLDEGFVLPTATTPSTAAIASVSGAQDYLHKLAGLTTKPDVFANGCNPQVLGLPGTSGILLLGTTSGGASIAAQLADSGLYVILTDAAANTSKVTQITNTQNAGYFSAASLRNNGIMDLVETSLTDPVTQKKATAVLLGNGDGTFKPAVYYDVSDNGLGLFTIDDVNGDGVPDIVELTITGTAVSGVTTLIGKGDGTFTVGPTSSVSGVPSDQPATGDFNGDGKKDLLVGGTVLFGSNDGRFTVGPTNSTLASIVNYLFPGAVGDLRNNGKLDVVVTNEGGSVWIFYGNGDGTFTAGPTYAALPDYMQVTITDIDGDGNPDIVLGTSTGGVYTIGGYDTPLPMYQVLMGRGDGTFVDSRAYPEGSYSGGTEIASADFNGDGKPDVLIFKDGNGIQQSELIMLPGDGKGNLGTAVTTPLPNSFPKQMVSADMNGDGKPDAVLIGNTQLAVLFNQGNGTFAGEQDYTLPMSAVSLATGDFNGDGAMDVAVGVPSVQAGSGGSGGVYVLLGENNHTLAAPVQIDSSVDPTGLAAGSLTGNGRSDLIVADQGIPGQTDGALHVYLGNADGTFTAKTAPTTTASAYSVAALGDLNHDGKADLLVAGSVPGTSGNPATPTLYTLLGNGDGTFQTANVLALADVDGLPNSIALADFNKSGNLGAVLGNTNDYTEVLLGNGDGTLTETLMALGQHPYTVAAADLLGNGYPEVLIGESNSYGQGALVVFLNSTVWTATTPTLTSTTTALSASAANIPSGTSVTFTATVAPTSGSGVPTGTVTFLDGSTTLGTGTLSSGTAAYSTSSLSAGTHSITASYGGDSSNAASTSTAVSVVVTGTATGDFSISLSPTSGSVAQGSSATTTVSITPSGGFNQQISFSCSGLPANASCAFSPATVTPSGASAVTTTLTVKTGTASAALGRPAIPLRGSSTEVPIALGFLGGAGLLGFSLSRWRRTKSFGFMCLGMVATLTLFVCSIAGCGSSSPKTSGGTYTVTVTATAGSDVHTADYTLTVQ